ncbi:MAG: hypothetical protein GEV08_22725, partial [Acidimicrobiia bacterium]|nr:hypothetical protein [Acidimicrobiia bacterium]
MGGRALPFAPWQWAVMGLAAAVMAGVAVVAAIGMGGTGASSPPGDGAPGGRPADAAPVGLGPAGRSSAMAGGEVPLPSDDSPRASAAGGAGVSPTTAPAAPGAAPGG